MEYAQSFLDVADQRLGLHVYPEPGPDAPIVVVWPAMGVPARYYRPFAEQLHAQGLAVVVADLRGTGSSTPRPSRRSRYGYRDLASDVGAVMDHLRPDGRTVILFGHSLGGQACALHLALSRSDAPDMPRVDALALVAVGLPYFRAYRSSHGAWVLLLAQWINAVSAVAQVWPGWGFGGRQARGVIKDWAYTARHGRFPRMAGVDVEAALGRVRTPVLAVSVDGDAFTPAPTVDLMVSKMTRAPVRRRHLTTAEIGRVNHFTWVRASTPIAALVAELTIGSGVTDP
jgi:predicted alpha/beta hydrolase